MTLCVGIGNTNIRCAVGSAANYTKGVLLTEKAQNADDFTCFIEDSFQSDIWQKLERCIISSVVPQKNEIIEKSLRNKRESLSVQYVDLTKCNVDFSRYKTRLGDDRAVCSAAAAARYDTPIIVVDFGTATTVNVINEEKIFLGGAILVGVKTGLAALSSATAQLGAGGDLSRVTVIGEDTNECLVSGAVIGTVAMVEGYVTRIKNMLGKEPTIVLTGGNATKITPYCDFDFVHEPSLLIEGLFLLQK